MAKFVIGGAALVVLLAGVGFLAGSRGDAALDSSDPVEIASSPRAVPKPIADTPSDEPSPTPALPPAPPTSPPPTADPSPAPSPEASTEPGAPLWGRTFVSVSVTEDGRPRPLIGGTRLEVTFERRDDGVDVVRWRAGCNAMGGEVLVSGDRLDVSEIAGTDMGCDDARHAQDEWTARFFAADPAWMAPDGGLRLEAGETVIELEAAA